MIYDLTADILESGIRTILAQTANVITGSDNIEIPDDFEGYIVQVKHTANVATDASGRIPVLATYEAEIERRVFQEAVEARQIESGSALKARFANYDNFAIALGEDDVTLNVISCAVSQEEIATTETGIHLFTTTLEFTVQPLIVQDEEQ